MKKLGIVALVLDGVIILCLLAILVLKGPNWYFIKYNALKGVSLNTSKESTNILYHKTRQSGYDALDYDQNKIIFFGDSLTEYGNWSELFHDNNIINRGIGGDTTFGLLDRISEITNLKPNKLFIMAGINDLTMGHSVYQTYSNYNKIINIVKEKSPKTKIYIQSTLPINNKINRATVTPGDIVNLNQKLKSLAANNGSVFIDLFNTFADKKGHLQSKFTYDGTHLKGDGYLIWKQKINEYVQQ